MDWKVALIVLVLVIWGLSHLMEQYKKVLRKGKSGKKENIAVALVLSVLFVAILYILKLLLLPVGVYVWLMLIAYTAVIYYVQAKVDMKYVKKLGKVAIEEKLKELGITPEQLKQMEAALE
jgi:Flp pilus assembly protein TadB